MRIGTRASALALAQAGGVCDALAGHGTKAELVPITTSGDEQRTTGTAGPGDKSRFTREIEQALLAGDVDLAVHSAKDVPGELPEGLAIVAVPRRADARDALCGAASVDELPAGAAVGTSSLRRHAQLLALRPDLELRGLRGNVDTRLLRLAEGDYDALVLAAAGLDRLGRDEGTPVPVETMTPAPGQGCLVIEARTDDAAATEATAPLIDHHALVALTAERALVAGLAASCDTPMGAHARTAGDGVLELRGFAGLPDGSAWVHDAVEGDAADPAALGRTAAERLLAAGARELLDEAERMVAAARER